MGRGVGIEVTGLKELQKKLGKIPENVKVELEAEMEAVAQEFVNRAVGDAPVDEGVLKGGISYSKTGEMQFEIVSRVGYSAFVEWGTRTRVQVPAELSSYASQFKGVKGSGDFKKSIFDWCKRKGIEQKYWFPIFLKVLRIGASPHPFFFTQLPQAQADLNKSLKQVVAKALSK